MPDQFSGADSRHLSMPMVDSGHDGLSAQPLIHGSFCGFVVDLGPLDVHQLTLPPDREFTGLLKEAWGSGVYVLRVMVSSPFHFLAVFYHVHDNFSSCGLKLWEHYIPSD